MQLENVLAAFALTLLAGLATGVGSVMAFFAKKLDRRFLSVSLGFSAGVMIYVSLVEMFAEAKEQLASVHGLRLGNGLAVAAFFAGFGLIALIDKLVPSYENPHELREVAEAPPGAVEQKALLRMGMFSAVAIGIHNFPEGLATFIGSLQDPTLGVSIAVAIAIHNIPEGIAVSVPVYYATGSKKKAFTLSFLSGLSEPVGAILGYFLVRAFFGKTIFGLVFALVAGIMIYISLDELLPSAEKYGEHHLAVYGLAAGMVVMAVSLLLLL